MQYPYAQRKDVKTRGSWLSPFHMGQRQGALGFDSGDNKANEAWSHPMRTLRLIQSTPSASTPRLIAALWFPSRRDAIATGTFDM